MSRIHKSSNPKSLGRELTSGKAYDFYFVAENVAGYLQSSLTPVTNVTVN